MPVNSDCRLFKSGCIYNNNVKFLYNDYACSMNTPYGNFQCGEAFYQFLKFVHLDDKALLARFLSANANQARELALQNAAMADPEWNMNEALDIVLGYKFNDHTLKCQLMLLKDSDFDFLTHEDSEINKLIVDKLMVLKQKYMADGDVSIAEVLSVSMSF